jgi:tetratricopeptide (TPR) repeat protein
MRWGAIVLAALVLAQSGNARGDDVATARARFQAGTTYYNAGQYDLAIHEYEASYRLSAAPGLLFNIAQAYRLKGDAARALDYYQRFVAARPDSPIASEARGYIDEMQRLLAESKPAPKPATATTTPPLASPSTITLTAPAPAPQRATPFYRKWWPWAIAGGVVVIGIGIGIGVANSPPNFHQTFPDVGPGAH